jgi:2-polyprenyl-6-methoxyphenol hydroxylase-like FAD-dependent oxidoreductase
MATTRDEAFEVVIAGGGPTGLMLACELALAGVRAVVLEKLPERPGFCRGFNLNARSLELLDRRGLVERFLAEGWRVPVTGFAGLETPLSLADLDSDHPYVLGIPQTRTEELIEARAVELGAPIRRGCEVVALAQDGDGVDVVVRGPEGESTLRAAYLAGCDGGRSTVRKLAGIAFPGSDATGSWLLGDVELGDPASLSVGSHKTPSGSVFVIPRPGYVRIITAEREKPSDRDAPVTLAQLREAVRLALGRDVELARPRWLTRFGDAARQAERYVSGRVVLAGDAAHIHPPAGAQGLNVGLQDAFNLGWKLAAQVHGWAPPGLLGTYHAERHADGARVLLNTRAQVALADPNEKFDPLRAFFSELAALEPVRRRLIEAATGVGTRYEITMGGDEPHPLAGRLAPNWPLEAAGGPTKLSTFLHAGRGVLLDLADRSDLRAEASGWSDRVDAVAARGPEGCAADALLLRPDGYVAWASAPGGGNGPRGLRESLTAWFGSERR